MCRSDTWALCARHWVIKDEGQPINCLSAISTPRRVISSELMHLFASAFISSPMRFNRTLGLFTFLSSESPPPILNPTHPPTVTTAYCEMSASPGSPPCLLTASGLDGSARGCTYVASPSSSSSSTSSCCWQGGKRRILPSPGEIINPYKAVACRNEASVKHLAQEASQAVARTGTCCCPCPTFHERVLSRE